MTIVGIACGLISSLTLVALLVAVIHERGYRAGAKAGWRNGYQVGLTDANNWWIRAEEQADEERQKIWKEDAQP
jgi:hypothetical protein